MALTVEELQIVLSCDATTAQAVLEKMDATVKAYTQKFQRYFNTIGGKGGKSSNPLGNVAKNVEREAKSSAKSIESITKRAKKSLKDMVDFTPKYKHTGLGYEDVSKTINEKIKNGREAAEAYNKEFAKASPSKEPPNTKLLNLGVRTAKDLQAVYAQANKIGAVSGVMREKIFQAYKAMQKLGKEYSKIAGEQGGSSKAAQKAEEAYRKAIYAVDKYVQQLGKAVTKEEELAHKEAELAAKRLQKDPKQVRAGNINAENNPQWGHQGEGRMLAPSFAETFKATLASLPDLVNNFVMKATNALSTAGKVIGKVFSTGVNIAVGAIRVLGTVAEAVAGAIKRVFQGVGTVIKTAFRSAVGIVKRVGSTIKKAFNNTLLGKFINRLRTVALRMAAMKLIRGTIEGAKKGLEELAKTSASSAKAMNTIKAAGGSIKMALGAAVMPIVKALAPLFVRLAGAISAAGNAIARFFAVVTGQSHYTAVNFSSDLDGISESAGGAGSAVKGMLADFDELNVLQKNSGGGGGGSSGVEQSLSTVADLDAVSSLGDKVREAIESGNWTGVGEALNSKLNGISEKIKKWGKDLKNSDLGENIAEFFNGLFGEESTFYNLGDSVGTVLDGIITQVGEFIENFNWEDAGKAIKAFFQGISDALDRNEFVLKLKIKINEIKEQFQQFKVDLLVWANGLPDWVKDFLGWFGADIPAALDKAATELANTRIEGANLQTKLNELNNTDVDVEVDAEVGDTVDPVDLVKGPGWRPASGTHGKKVGEGTAEIIPGVDKPLDTPDLVGKNTGVYSTGNGLALTLGVAPTLGDRSNLINGMNKYVVRKDNPWSALVNPTYNTGKGFFDNIKKYVTGVTWKAPVNPTYNTGKPFYADLSKYVTGKIWKALVNPAYNTMKTDFLPSMEKNVTKRIWKAPVNPAYNTYKTDFLPLMQKNVTGKIWKALVNPTYNTGKQFNADMRTYITDKIAKKLVNPTYGTGKGFNADLRTYITDKIAKKYVNPTYGTGKGFNADLKTYITDKTALKKVNPTYGSGKQFNADLQTYVTDKIASKKVNPVYGSGKSFNDALYTNVTKDSANKKVNPYYNSDKNFFDELEKKITGVTNITKVNPALSVPSTYTKAVSDATATKTLKVNAALSIDKTKTNNAIAAAMKGASAKVSLTIGGETVTGDINTYARGGIAYGTTSAIIGEYRGAKSNPEVVAPLNKLQGILERSNTGGNKDTMTREQANTMIGLLRELTKKETVVRPSVELGQVVDRSLKAYART